MTKSELNKMNEAALAELAERLGLEVNPGTATKKFLIESIETKLAEQSRVEEEDNEENEELVLEEGVTPQPKKPAAPKRYKIMIHAQESDPSPFIKVSINGKMYQIYRDQEVVVPEEVKHVLDNAVMTVFQRVGNVMEERNVRRYPFSVLEVL